MKNKYESEALMVSHQEAEGMHRLGIISDARMREFDEMCLASPKIKQESNSVYNEENDTVSLEHSSHATV